MEWVNFRHLYSFWMVCKHSGFKKASEQMLVSQSAVSDQVAQLEGYLDVRLLDRSTRVLKVTETGTQLLAYAETIFKQSREINQVIRDRKTSQLPTVLKVGIVGGISRNFLYRLFQHMLSSVPSATLDIINGGYDELNQLLKSYELDFFISLEPPQTKDLSHLAYKTIGQSPLCLAGKKNLIGKVKRTRKKAIPCTLFEFKIPYEKNIIEDLIEPSLNIKAESRLSTDDISLLRFLANSGEGLVVIPEVGVQEDIRSGVIDRLFLRALPTIKFYALYLKNGLHDEVIRSL